MNSYKRDSRNVDRDPVAVKAYRMELKRAQREMQSLRAQITEARKRRNWRTANYLTYVFYTCDSSMLVNPFHGVRRRRKPRRKAK